MTLTKKQKELLKMIRQQKVLHVKQWLEDNDIHDGFQNFSDMTPLHEAVRTRNFPIVKALVEAGHEINCLSKARLTPLDIAIEYQAKNITSYLKRHGAVMAEELQEQGGNKSSRTLRDKTAQKQALIDGKTLADFFNADRWIGNTKKMQEAWEKMPRGLKKQFDFASALTEAQQKTLKNQGSKKLKKNKNQDIPPP